MSVYKNGNFYHFDFKLDGERYRGSTGTANKEDAKAEENSQRDQLEMTYSQVIEAETREQRRKTIQVAADEFLIDYIAKRESPSFAEYALGHVCRLLGRSRVGQITPKVVKQYQADRLREKASPKSINDEVKFLIRLCGEHAVLIRESLRRQKALYLPVGTSPGRKWTRDEKARLLEKAAKLRSPMMHTALAIDQNTGLRGKELRELRIGLVDLINQQIIVGKSKTKGGTGRIIPLNEIALGALEKHFAWYTRRFGACRPEWFVFPFGAPFPTDPTRPITSFKTAWTNLRKIAEVKGRWHDNRHTFITELGESGAGDRQIIALAGHTSPAMLARYSHLETQAKRRAVDDIAASQRVADEKRKQELECKRQAETALKVRN